MVIQSYDLKFKIDTVSKVFKGPLKCGAPITRKQFQLERATFVG